MAEIQDDIMRTFTELTLQGPTAILNTPYDPTLVSELRSLSGLVHTLNFSHASNFTKALDHVSISVDFSVDPPLSENYKEIVLFLDKAKLTHEALLSKISSGSNDEVEVFILGHKLQGIKSIGKILGRYFKKYEKIFAGNHCAIWQATHPIKPNQNSLTLKFQVSLNEKSIQLTNYPGVFAYGKLDKASQLLLESYPSTKGGSLLDICCGCGALGTYYALQQPSLTVTFSDVRAEALESTRQTLLANKIENAAVIASDLFSKITGKYDTIVCNPPFHQGREQDLSMAEKLIVTAGRYLSESGHLVLVANQFLPYERLLQTHFSNVTRIGEDGSYIVYKSQS